MERVFLLLLAVVFSGAVFAAEVYWVTVTPATDPADVPKGAKHIRFEGVSGERADAVLRRVSAPETLILNNIDLDNDEGLRHGVAFHGKSITSLRLANCDLGAATKSWVAALSKLERLERLDLDQQPLDWRMMAGGGEAIHAREAVLSGWELLAIASFPRLEKLEVHEDLHDPGLAVRLAESWSDSFPALTDFRLRGTAEANLAVLILIDRTPLLHTVELRWHDDELYWISEQEAAILHRTQGRVQTLILNQPPLWKADAATGRGDVWEGLIASETVKHLRYDGELEPLADALARNKSVWSLTLTRATDSDYAANFARRVVSDTGIGEFHFDGMRLDYLRGLSKHRLESITVAHGTLAPRSAEEVERLFATRPTTTLHIDGKHFESETFSAMDAALATGLAKWRNVEALTLDAFDVLPAATLKAVARMETLQRLQVEGLDAKAWGDEIRLPNLKELRIGYITDAEGFERIAAMLPGLESFRASTAQPAMVATTLARMEKLQSVELHSDVEIAPALLELLKSTTLRRVAVWGTGNIEPSDVPEENIRAPLLTAFIFTDGEVAPTVARHLKQRIDTLRRIAGALNARKDPEVASYFNKRPEVELIDWAAPGQDDDDTGE